MRSRTPIDEYGERPQGRLGKAIVAVLVVVILLVALDKASGSRVLYALSHYQHAMQPHAQQKSALWLNTQETLGDVQDMLLQLGMEEYFTLLRNNGFTNLNAIGGSQQPPPKGMKPYHWKLIRKEAYLLLQPDDSQERAVAVNPNEDYPDATPEQLADTICRSWSNTEGLHLFMKSFKAGKNPDVIIPNTTVPACPKRKDPRGVLFSTLMSDPHIATAVGMDGGWYRNNLQLNQVRSLRQRGIVQQLIFDHDLRIMYCGIPKAQLTLFKSWFLKGANAWNVKMRSNDSSGEFNGPRLESGRFMTDHQVMTNLNSGEYFKFTYVRDPFTRVLAAFHERIHECPSKRSPAECRQWVRLLTGMNSRRAKLEGLSFRQFVTHLKKLKKRKGTVDVTYQTAHYLPQTDVCGLDQIAYDFIGKVENDDVDTQVLYDIVGRQGLTSRQKRTFDPSLSISSMVFHYGVDEETITANVKALKDVYEADRRLLGYVGESLFSSLTGGREE